MGRALDTCSLSHTCTLSGHTIMCVPVCMWFPMCACVYLPCFLTPFHCNHTHTHTCGTPHERACARACKQRVWEFAAPHFMVGLRLKGCTTENLTMFVRSACLARVCYVCIVWLVLSEHCIYDLACDCRQILSGPESRHTAHKARVSGGGGVWPVVQHT